MSLASMVIFDEDALICDMAETYGIFDLYALPAQLTATLAVGLREDSRIKVKMSGMKMDFNKYILAALFDKVNWLCWTKTKDAQHGTHVPESILDLLLQTDKQNAPDEFMVFDSPEEFEKARQDLLGEIQDG
jgi:hypothetical protein